MIVSLCELSLIKDFVEGVVYEKSWWWMSSHVNKTFR